MRKPAAEEMQEDGEDSEAGKIQMIETATQRKR